jgi:Cu/Ag efflux protein CusF
MKIKHAMASVALFASLAAASALAQAPKPERLIGVIEKVDGHTVMVKSAKGDTLKLNLADKVMVVQIEKASLADIKDGDYIGSGAMPQPDGTQKAVEVHIFAETMRGTGEGFGPWTQPGSTMTNGTVGATVTGVSGPVITVKYKGGEQKIVVPPGTPIVKYVIGDAGDIKPGAKFRVNAALKQPDGSFNVSRINVGP